jgi:hypothetical protein
MVESFFAVILGLAFPWIILIFVWGFIISENPQKFFGITWLRNIFKPWVQIAEKWGSGAKGS